MPFSEELLAEAVRGCLSVGKPRRFKQGVEVVITFTGLDLKSPEAKLREIVFLPHGPGKNVRVCIVAEGDMLLEARKLGVEAYSRQDIQALDKKAAKKLARRCDWVLVRADIMGVAGKVLGPALGPRGKAPIAVPPNANVTEVVEKYRKAVWVRIRNQPQTACRVGSEDMKVEEIVENAKAVLDLVESKIGLHKVKSVYFKKTMSPPLTLKMG
ncbi:MAG: 50S ribosomal protein L1 [Thermoprotei archaeon]|nr:50S ribosomal protein L1 [Thermoprotei archaeon]